MKLPPSTTLQRYSEEALGSRKCKCEVNGRQTPSCASVACVSPGGLTEKDQSEAKAGGNTGLSTMQVFALRDFNSSFMYLLCPDAAVF